MSKNLRGVVPPVCTPLTPEMEVDVPSLERLVDYLLAGGVEGLFILGSTSEVAFLPDRQRKVVLDTVVARAGGQVPVVAGAIDTSTLRVLEHIKVAEAAGVDGVVATGPFYLRTHPVEIDRHFRLLGERSATALFAYDVPVSVHSKLSTALVLSLAEDGVIAGIKDSSGDDGGLRKLALAARDTATLADFSVLTGAELTVDTAFRFGIDGVVPGLANVDPAGYVRLARACADGDWDAAAKEQERLIRLFDIVGCGDPARMGASSAGLGAFKAGLYLRGIIDHPVTALPQVPLNEAEINGVREVLIDTGLL